MLLDGRYALVTGASTGPEASVERSRCVWRRRARPSR